MAVAVAAEIPAYPKPSYPAPAYSKPAYEYVSYLENVLCYEVCDMSDDQ